MEYRDIYDENKRRTGRTVAAGAKRRPGEYILCVGCWVIGHDRRIFLTKRSPEKKFMPDKWENQGGHAVAGEDGPDAALRELYEETGIRAAREDLILLSQRREDTYFVEDYVVVRDFDLSEVVLQPGETCDAKWADEAEWQRMLTSGEIAPSVNEKLQPHKQRLLDILHAL